MYNIIFVCHPYFVTMPHKKKCNYCFCTAFAIFVLFMSLICLVPFSMYIQNLGWGYEDRPKSQYFTGAKNESYHIIRGLAYVEADFDDIRFWNYVNNSRLKVIPIGPEGFDIQCYKFKKIHPYQKKWLANSEKKYREFTCRIYNGYYFMEEKEGKKWVIAYNTDNKRIYGCTNYGECPWPAGGLRTESDEQGCGIIKK